MSARLTPVRREALLRLRRRLGSWSAVSRSIYTAHGEFFPTHWLRSETGAMRRAEHTHAVVSRLARIEGRAS